GRAGVGGGAGQAVRRRPALRPAAAGAGRPLAAPARPPRLARPACAARALLRTALLPDGLRRRQRRPGPAAGRLAPPAARRPRSLPDLRPPPRRRLPRLLPGRRLPAHELGRQRRDDAAGDADLLGGRLPADRPAAVGGLAGVGAYGADGGVPRRRPLPRQPRHRAAVCRWRLAVLAAAAPLTPAAAGGPV